MPHAQLPCVLCLSALVPPVPAQARAANPSCCRAAGITFVSVGHRPTLRKYHDNVLLLHGAGGRWEVRRADEVSLEKIVDFMD